MTRIPTLFFATGAVFVLIGMAWGIQMSASQDFKLSPAHAHLNLIGFVVMSDFGTFYALNPPAASSRLAMPHYALSVVAVLVLVPGIVMAIRETGETLAKLGSFLAIASAAVYLVVILRHGFRQAAKA